MDFMTTAGLILRREGKRALENSHGNIIKTEPSVCVMPKSNTRWQRHITICCLITSSEALNVGVKSMDTQEHYTSAA